MRDNFKLITELINELRAAKNESVYLVPGIDIALNKLKQQRERLLQDETFAEIFLCKDDNKLYLEKNIIDELANTKESLPILEKMHENIIELKGELLLGEESFNEICASMNKKLALIIIHSENSYNKDENRTTDGTLEDIIKKGLAAKIDLVIDGNNILLRNLHRNNALVEFSSLSEARNDFNSKVKSKASMFKNIYIVYDGVEDKEIPSGNCRIVFTNKLETIADDKIYSMIASHKAGSVMLATADEGLISRNPNALILGAKHCYEFFLS
ncbi:MAG: NYN domain-containing protein [Thermodesulfovibrionales bacterium]|nr:NYN domain-containing protein [Thermodesulfovibrionales bacterium]